MNEIHLADCRTFAWPDADVMIADPPYAPRVHAKAVSQSRYKGTNPRDLGFNHLTPDLCSWTCDRAAKVSRWSLIYSDIESVGMWKQNIEDAGATYIRAIPWVRWSMPQLTGDRPPSGCEMLIVAYGHGKGRKHWSGPGNLTHLAHKCMRGAFKHKTQKPLEQVLDLLTWFSDPNDFVISPFGGRGTDTVACKVLGRRSLSTELDPIEYGKAVTRLSEVVEDDEHRIGLWRDSQKIYEADRARMKAHTAKIREKLDSKETP